MGVNDEITNRPRLVIDDKILDVANLAVQGLDMMAADTVSAAQMGIPTFPVLGGCFPLLGVTHQVGIISPAEGADPILRVAVMPVVGLLELVGDRLVGVQGGTILNLLFG